LWFVLVLVDIDKLILKYNKNLKSGKYPRQSWRTKSKDLTDVKSYFKTPVIKRADIARAGGMA
jgi:hypothetical protein